MKENNIEIDDEFTNITFSEGLIRNATELSYNNKLSMGSYIKSYYDNVYEIINMALINIKLCYRR